MMGERPAGDSTLIHDRDTSLPNPVFARPRVLVARGASPLVNEATIEEEWEDEEDDDEEGETNRVQRALREEEEKIVKRLAELCRDVLKIHSVLNERGDTHH
jgi:hypothetical protein